MVRFFCIINFVFLAISCREFLYPVAPYCDAQGAVKVLVMYQKTPDCVELWQWEALTHVATKVLFSSFSPSGIQISPDMRGFSFVDEGRIRFKEFCKRSPKTVYLSRPLYDIGFVRWHDTNTLYFSAKEHENYGVFSVALSTEKVTCHVQWPNVDCMYPCIIEDSLFYIERSLLHCPQEVLFDPLDRAQQSFEKYRYHIVQTSLLPSADKKSASQVIIDFQTRPVIFLTMLSATQGFIIEHPEVITKQDAEILFLVHLFEQDDDDTQCWHTEHLFSFAIPTALLRMGSPERLCESLLPLVPRFYESYFYYVDCTNREDRCLAIKIFDVRKKSNEILIYNKGVHYFVPLLCDSLLFFGGSLIHNTYGNANFSSGPGSCMASNHNKEICLSFSSLNPGRSDTEA